MAFIKMPDTIACCILIPWKEHAVLKKFMVNYKRRMTQDFYKPILFLLTIFSSLVAAPQDTSIRNSIGMAFVLVQPGSFVMGKFQPSYPKPVEPKKETDHANAERGY